jgi:hypothetical protein
VNDVGKAFSYPFKDPAWVSKFILGALFMVLGIFLVGIFIVVGYFIETTQRVMRRELHPLPEWTDVGVKLVLGVKFCVVYLVYLIPIFILYIPFLALILVGSLSDNGDMLGALAGIYVGVMVFLFIIPYSLLLAAMLPIITYRFARNEKVSEALDIAAVFRTFKRNWQNTLVVALIAVGLHSFAAVGIVFFLVGVLFTIFYSYLVSAHMFGSLYLEETHVEATT